MTAPDAETGIARIATTLATHGRRAAVMPYVIAGYPDLPTSRALGEACVDAGADMLELGMPYCDPLAGPVNHAAASAALAAGATTDGVLAVAAELAERTPVILTCYANVVLAHGVTSFADRLARARVSGVLVPDMPFEESAALMAACEDAGVALISIVAPTTSPDRMVRIAAAARGFLYVISVRGMTGARALLPTDLAAVARRAASHATVPLAVGFGITTPEHAVAAAGVGAGLVVVGGPLIKAAGESDDPVSVAREFVGAVTRALGRSDQRGVTTASQ